MKVLIVGSGGREHALAWRIANNPDGIVHNIYCAPGNAGMTGLAEQVPIKATDIEGLCAFALENRIEYTIVGMDDPLERGIVDRFREAGLEIFGPTRAAAKLEWSKSYAKGFMKKYGIPTAACEVFDDDSLAMEYCKKTPYPIVIKADGLAVGKGVYICKDQPEAENALKEIMSDKKFGSSGERVVIEEFLKGPETTVMAFCDGRTIVPMVSSMDHKKAFDGNEGPNTGGMGAVSPSPYFTKDIESKFKTEIMLPTLEGIIKEGLDYRGFLYFGLMFTEKGPYVIEYNARFGDPEAQAVLPLLTSNLLNICIDCTNKRLDKAVIKWDNRESACVCLVSEGYPGSYETGFPIGGLDALGAEDLVFYAGVKALNGGLATSGGRVLGVTGLGTEGMALTKAYEAVGKINFRNMRYRSDIGRV